VSEHERHAESLAAYMLGALPDEERDQLERHLEVCDRCRADAAALQPALDVLPVAVSPMVAPPELKARVMAVVDAEAQLLGAAGSEADRPSPQRPRRRGLGALFPRTVIAAGAAAAALAVGIVSGVALLPGDGGSQRSSGRVVAAHITDPSIQHTATAALRMDSGRASLIVRNLPDPPRDRVYQVWVKSASQPPVPAGATFAVRSGVIEIPHSVARSQEVIVTSEPVGGSTLPTRAPLIIARPA